VLCLGIGYAPPRPARQIDGHLLALVQAESIQRWSFHIVPMQATIPSARRLMIAAFVKLRAGHRTSPPLESAAPGQSVSTRNRIAIHHAIAPITIRPMAQARIGLKRI